MDYGDLFAPVATGVQGVVTDLVPVAIPVFIVLASITIAIKVFRKFGVRN